MTGDPESSAESNSLADTIRRQLTPGRVTVAVAAAFVCYRLWLATQSGFGFHHGWNEGHYALIARGYLTHPLVPQYGPGAPRYSVPPLFPYLVAVSFELFGQSTLAARFPSVLAGGGTIVATYGLGRHLYDDRVGVASAILLALLPMFGLYAGRAQTDVLLTFLFTVAIWLVVSGFDAEMAGTGYRRVLLAGIVLGAAFTAKQPAVLAVPVVAVWLLSQHRYDRDTLRRGVVYGAGTIIGLLPFAIWAYLNFRLAPEQFVGTWRHELFGRTAPFANLPLIAAVGVGLGITPAVGVLAAGRAWMDSADTLRGLRTDAAEATRRLPSSVSVETVWLVVVGAFVLYRTPHGHQYYVVTLTPAVAILAVRGFATARTWAPRALGRPDSRRAITVIAAAVLLVSTLGGTAVLYEFSGEYSASEGSGSTVVPETANGIAALQTEGSTVYVPSGYQPQFRWYLRGDVPIGSIKPYDPASLTPARVQRMTNETDDTTYLVVPDPIWGPGGDLDERRVFRSDPYEPTLVTPLSPVIRTNSKLGYYVGDRRLAVYRLDRNDSS